MSLPKVSILYANGGLLAEIAVLDGIVGLIGTGNTMLLQPKVVYNLTDAEEQGFTEDDEPVAYRHIKEFYQEVGGTQELHIMLVPSTMTMEEMADDTEVNGAKKLLIAGGGRIRMVGLFRSPDNGYDPGDEFIDADVSAALLKAKTFCQARVTELVPVRMLIEGRVVNPEVLATATYTVTVPGTAGNIATLKSNDGENNVTLGAYTVIADDDASEVATGIRAAINALTGTHGYKASGTGAAVIVKAPVGTGAAGNDFILTDDNTGTVDGTIVDFAGGSNMLANTLLPNTFSNGYAAVVLGGSLSDGSASIGTATGRLAKYAAHIKMGKVANGPLALTTCYIGNQEIKNILGLAALHGAGFISFMKQPGKAGFYFGIDRMASTDDYRLMAYGRVIDKAAIIAAAVYIEELEGEVDVDADGKIDSLALAGLRDDISQAINVGMGTQISGLIVNINPDQNIINTGTLNVQLRVRPKGYKTFINVDLGLIAPSN